MDEKERNNEACPEFCTVTNCFYNSDCWCTCCDDLRNRDLLEDCPSFMED